MIDSGRTVVLVPAPGRQLIVVIGVGNEFRHDDGIGPALVDDIIYAVALTAIPARGGQAA